MNLDLTDEQQDIRSAAREFAEKEFTDIATECDTREQYPLEIWKKACGLGFIGLSIAEAFGGSGLGLLEHTLVMEEFSRVDPGCSSILLSAESAAIIQEYGREDQKQRYLRGLVEGTEIMGICLGGSINSPTAPVIYAKAERGGREYRLNGTASFFRNGGTARHLIVYCHDEAGAASGNHFGRLFIVETASSGCDIAKVNGKFGQRAADVVRVRFEDVKVEKEDFIDGKGGESVDTSKFENRLKILFAAHNVGIAEGAMEKAIYYARTRKAFGNVIGVFDVIQAKIGEMATCVEGARKFYYSSAWRYDQGKQDTKGAAIAAWYAAETSMMVADQAVQIHGGYGYIKESDVERFYRDATTAATSFGIKDTEKIYVGRQMLGL